MSLYLLSIYQPQDSTPPADELNAIMDNVGRVVDDLKSSGGWVFGGGLHPTSTATVVRAGKGDPIVTDGPFIEAKEYIGGLNVIEVEDLDAALEWARRFSEAMTLPIEVRPFQG